MLLWYNPVFTAESKIVTIKVKGRVHTYHHTADLDNYTTDDNTVAPPDSKLQLSWVYLFITYYSIVNRSSSTRLRPKRDTLDL